MPEQNTITLKKIKSFISGYSNYYYDNIIGLPAFVKEQVFYRLYICQDTCLVSGKCEFCTCPTIKKVYAHDSCGNPNLPTLMDKQSWDEFKIKNQVPDSKEIEKAIDEAINKLKNR